MKLDDRLKESYEQADYTIVKIKGSLDVRKIQEKADHFMKQHPKFKGLSIYDDREKLIYENYK
ncbi:MAG: hypothetical protein LBG92_06430 [Prevotellaceae bacterium]|nr:hypothetical protein [Prevotellaceae bacterium]